jgi:anaerobic selenocysteine-containing dehydrogenase
MTPISRNADLYLPLRPGTDLVLLMSILHVILEEGLENKKFIVIFLAQQTKNGSR